MSKPRPSAPQRDLTAAAAGPALSRRRLMSLLAVAAFAVVATPRQAPPLALARKVRWIGHV
jgi:hypothetical protein